MHNKRDNYLESVDSKSRDGPDTPIYNIIHYIKRNNSEQMKVKVLYFAVLIFGKIPFHRAPNQSYKQLSTCEPDSYKIVNLST